MANYKGALLITVIALVTAGALAWQLSASSFAHSEAVSNDTGVKGSCAAIREEMVRIPAGLLPVGDGVSGEPGDMHQVPEFWIDRHEVTNREFAAFVAATGYVTTAEREGGGAVFVAPDPSSMDIAGPANWWRFVKGADWRHPTGPESSIASRLNHPVVQVSFEDALAYADWAGAELPNEYQWERAARGQQQQARSPYSWAFSSDGHPLANTWQGEFPFWNADKDGFLGTAPVGCFQPNDFGVYDMIGNVWEWTLGQKGAGRRVLRGGSYLCSLNYCANFRPAGSQVQESDLPTSHVGFRTVRQ